MALGDLLHVDPEQVALLERGTQVYIQTASWGRSGRFLGTDRGMLLIDHGAIDPAAYPYPDARIRVSVILPELKEPTALAVDRSLRGKLVVWLTRRIDALTRRLGGPRG